MLYKPGQVTFSSHSGLQEATMKSRPKVCSRLRQPYFVGYKPQLCLKEPPSHFLVLYLAALTWVYTTYEIPKLTDQYCYIKLKGTGFVAGVNRATQWRARAYSNKLAYLSLLMYITSVGSLFIIHQESCHKRSLLLSTLPAAWLPAVAVVAIDITFA